MADILDTEIASQGEDVDEHLADAARNIRSAVYFARAICRQALGDGKYASADVVNVTRMVLDEADALREEDAAAAAAAAAGAGGDGAGEGDGADEGGVAGGVGGGVGDARVDGGGA